MVIIRSVILFIIITIKVCTQVTLYPITRMFTHPKYDFYPNSDDLLYGFSELGWM